MRKPLVSVLVAARDAQRTLGWALASVLAQTTDDWECVVVDDGSCHSMEPLVRAMGDTRIRCIRLTENHGRGYARALALREAHGFFFAILDADDWMYPARLERQLACLEARPKLALTGGPIIVEDLEHRIAGLLDGVTQARPQLGDFPFAFASMLIRSETARRVGFDERLTRAEDVLFLARALEEPWAVVPTPQYVYRPSPATRRDALEAHRCARAAYAQCRASNPLRARRLEFAYRAREFIHWSVSEGASQKLTTWAQSRVLRQATSAEIRVHREALATVQRHSDAIPATAFGSDEHS